MSGPGLHGIHNPFDEETCKLYQQDTHLSAVYNFVMTADPERIKTDKAVVEGQFFINLCNEFLAKYPGHEQQMADFAKRKIYSLTFSENLIDVKLVLLEISAELL